MSMDNKPKIVVVAGTNASGKSGLGIELARKFNGEIVSADSRQVYRRLNLGSGKVTEEEMKGVPHHLLDVRNPGEFFSMADFQLLAYQAIEDILARGKVPFLVGGTGLYVDAVAQGYVLSGKMPDLAYRAELEKLTTEELWSRLSAQMPQTQVDPRNRNRVMRMLEKIHDGDDGIPTKSPRYESLYLGVTWERQELCRRIDERLQRRLDQGMVEEVRVLLEEGVSEEFMLKLGLEYKFLTQYLLGQYAALEEMQELLATAIKQFAKRQMIWWRRNKSIHWLDMTGDPVQEASRLVESYLKGSAEEEA